MAYVIRIITPSLDGSGDWTTYCTQRHERGSSAANAARQVSKVNTKSVVEAVEERGHYLFPRVVSRYQREAKLSVE